MRVLVVDDDAGVRRVVRRGLEREGLEVTEAADGPEALAVAGEDAVDVAVLDLNLPGMSGLELLAELRRSDPMVHLIMLTGAGAEEDRILGLRSGADDYVVKPFSARELAARVVAAGRRRAGERPPGSDAPAPSAVADVDPDLEVELRRALTDDELRVHYQPIVSLGDGTWLGAEALVRWEHPQRGLLAPGAFIDHAERSGAILDVGQHVLDQACAQWSAWAGAGHDLHLSVNLSARQLADDDLPDRLADVIARSGIPSQMLWLEVTETALVDDLDQATGVVRRIAELGVGLSIDDFGTGWASLTYLQQFPVDALKIDRRFVAGLDSGSNDDAIVGSIVSLGRDLGLAVVAEGVETRRQREVLQDLGCRVGQGYLFARPAPPACLDPGARA